MADIKISELGAASAVNATDLFAMTSNGVTVKATAQQIKNYMGVGNLTDLNTTDKSSTVAAINEVNTKLTKTEVIISNSGDAYSPSRPYKVGELCIYNNVLYRCITACSAGSWTTNQSCFTADTLVNVITQNNVIQFINKSQYFASYITGGILNESKYSRVVIVNFNFMSSVNTSTTTVIANNLTPPAYDIAYTDVKGAILGINANGELWINGLAMNIQYVGQLIYFI